MGAALLVKPAAQKHFNLITCGVAHIGMDKESMTTYTLKPMPGEAMAACDGLALTSLLRWPSFVNINLIYGR